MKYFISNSVNNKVQMLEISISVPIILLEIRMSDNSKVLKGSVFKCLMLEQL
jgi:hypothetical protein